jgi:hypothetical protein
MFSASLSAGTRAGTKITLEWLRSVRTVDRAGSSLDFVDLHGGVEGEIGIANGGASRRGQMARRSSEFTAGAFNGVGIPITLGASHGNGIGRNKLVERSAMAVSGDVAAFRLGDLQEVASNAGEADGLRWSRTVIRGRHALHIEVIYDKKEGGSDQDASKRAHERIVARRVAHFKGRARRVALGNNVPVFALHCSRSVRLLSTAEFPSPVQHPPFGLTNEHDCASARTARA